LNLLKIFNSKSVKTAVVGSLGTKFFSAFFALASGILLARTLGLEGYGIYTLAFTTITLLSVPASLGLPNLITRYIAKYEVEENYEAIKGLLIRCNQFILISSVILVLGTLFTGFFWWKDYSKSFTETLWMGFLLLPLLSLGSIRAAALRGLHFVILGQLPDTLLRNLLLCIGVFIFYVLKVPLTPYMGMLIHVIAAAISYIVGFVFLKRKLLNKLREVKPIYHNKMWLKEAIPFSLNSGVQVIRSKLVTYVLAAFGSVTAVAIYDVALRGAALVAFTLDALNTAIAPHISAAFEKKDFNNLQKIITKTSRIIFAFSLPIALFFILGGDQLIVLLFGKEYRLAYIPLVILCIGQLISSLSGSVGLVLSMTGNQSYFTNSNIFITVLNIVLCIPLVKYFDVIGATIVYSFLLILQNFILLVYIKSKLKIKTMIF
jgi:O-antigen/teichoic acid export membrane protein